MGWPRWFSRHLLQQGYSGGRGAATLFIQHKVGAVFFTSGQERPREMLQTILNKWQWLEQIDAHVERPFAYLMTIAGRVRRVL
jgi:hypothetical protein